MDPTFLNTVAHFCDTTLADFRMQATAESGGCVYETMKQQPGKRVAIIACFVTDEWIELLQKKFVFEDGAPQVDWLTTTLGRVIGETMEMPAGLSYHAMRDQSGKLTALTICATAPQWIALFERLFDLH